MQTVPRSALRLIALLTTLILSVAPAAAGGDARLDHHDDALEEVVVHVTRSHRGLAEQPIRVEVLAGEELEEKLMMRPGNISMLLNETGGIRVQVTAPSIGAANIRTYGLRGRYTQLLADGLPIYGGQASSLGLLQIPPSDLGQVEIVKGAASALYGSQAMGGVINLVSKRPGETPSGELTFNTTSRDGNDFSAYFGGPLTSEFSASILGGYHRQSEQDLDADNWSDMPGYERFLIRPRLFLNRHTGLDLFMTAGLMVENRFGGALNDEIDAARELLPQDQRTERLDLGFVAETTISDKAYLQVRASGMQQQHDHRFGLLMESDRHETTLAEASLTNLLTNMSWVTGLSYQTDQYESEVFPSFDYEYSVPAVFSQLDYDISESMTVVASIRLDDHSEYGSHVSPRASVFYKPGFWSVRATWGQGFYAPTPFIEETEAAGLARLEPLALLQAEGAETWSVDIGYSAGTVEADLTLFGSSIDRAVRSSPVSTELVRLINQDGASRTRGVEALFRWRQTPWTVSANYMYLQADEPKLNGLGSTAVPLTPKHSAGVVAMWERHGSGRVGLELYYTGKQSLENNPYRMQSDPYLHIGLLGELVMGRFSVFINLENLLNVRQTRKDSLLLPARSPVGLWTVDAWAPLEGFIANVGFRLRIGANQ